MEDSEIVKLYFDRNEAAITESDAKYGGMLMNISYNILSDREDSRECVNDTYQKAWDSIPPNKPFSLAAYLGRIIRNLSINRWYENRARKRGGGATLLSELSECIPSPCGVEAETVGELLSLLGVEDKESLSSACGNFYRRLYTDNKIGKLKIANSLWIDSSFACNTDFAENAARNFYASSFIADFADAGTAKEMSRWISENTGGVLAPEINLNKSQIFSIINTVYFKDEWTSRFDPSATEAGDFYTDGGTVQCSYMNSDFASAGFVKGDGFTRSSLGLKNGGEMVFILPDDGVSARELVSSPEKLETAFRDGESSWGRVVWQIPKFDFGTSLELTDTLKACGISSAFDKSADFGGITDGPLFISRISQDTRIAIDENGVEAAAFTKIDYSTGTLPSDEAYMILDRPFIYGIISRDGVLLFAGICDNPAEN